PRSLVAPPGPVLNRIQEPYPSTSRSPRIMPEIHWAADAIYVADLLIRVVLSVRIIRRRLPVGVALAWLSVVLIFPFAGAVIYLLIGESRLGRGRARRAAALRQSYRGWAKARPEGDTAPPPELSAGAAGLARLAEAV